ncbi:Mth938-like domain-containing protein [Lutibaculum baratangense]|uniref:Uncharacterized protein n=1 Tax=Lutibaculum baratangense AMV1 TaxID=631454 RepID=V4RBM6_9HYPH|nr:MTH938/NDUFAF3 family protein [Lutibaculum baratangense]ESR23556.1 hypothetical protein N177_3624 [Lutibaculum baratangense AMV1]
MEMRRQHFPGRAPIDAYGNGGFRFADMSHRGSILVLPSGIYGWEPAEPPRVSSEDLGRLFEEDPAPELLLLGTGEDLVPQGPELRQALRELGVTLELMSTGAAARTYNVLLAEARVVAAALLAVE